jgi:tetratricopeptide (TPR) repeat protein
MVIATLGLFWAVLLLAVGVPATGVMLAAGIGLGAALVVNYRHELAGLGGWGRRGASSVRAAVVRLGDLPWASLRSRSSDGVQRAREIGNRALALLAARAADARKALASEPDPKAAAWRLNQVSANLRQQGRTTEALERSESALTLFRELGHLRGQALTLNSMGLALARRGETAEAIARFEEALELLAALGDAHGEGQVMANLGALNRRQGDEDQARSYWEDALTRLDPDSPEHRQLAEQLRLAS